ncbi:MAG: aminotransferase class I/II-fold pyridoxal phosphate-dependent enzyme [Terriglobia bacterium]
MKQLISAKPLQFTESVIREMTRQALIYGAVNLSQGFPDFPAPRLIKEAAIQAIQNDINQYSITWGAPNLREAIAERLGNLTGLRFDPQSEVTVCCGSTEGMIASLLAIINPGDEVIIFEPFYENYNPDAILSGATRRYVKLRPPDWSFDPLELASAFNAKTKAIIINTPNNPTGKVFRQEELEQIATLCQKWEALAITDEIYDHILYDDSVHVRLLTLDGMRDRTITVNSLSKTFSVTGWRVGYVVASPVLSNAIRKVHDFLTVGAAHPLQEAGAIALRSGKDYYEELRNQYKARRDLTLEILGKAGFDCFVPQGAYYIMTSIERFGFPDDMQFADHLVREIGVASVPGSSFYHESGDGKQQVRFCFCKKDETLQEAGRRLQRLRALR